MQDIRTILLGKRSFFVLIILGLSVINAIWLVPTLRNTHASASVFALTVAERIQSEINGSLETALNETVGVAGEVSEEPPRINSAFSNLLLRNPIFKSVALVSQNGKELIRVDSSGPLPPEKFIDQLRNPSLYLALQGTSKFGLPTISSNGELHMTLAVPVPKKGEFIDKVIIAELNVQNLLSIIRSPKIGQGHAYILDRDGVEILNPSPARILKHQDFSSRRIAKKVLVDGATADGLAQDDRYVNENGEDTFTVGTPVPVVKWGVFVEQPRSRAFAGEQQSIVLAAVTSLLAISIFFVIERSAIKLRGLTKQLQDANKRLRELDQMKSEFLSFATHQLRSPLTAIKGYASLILEGSFGKVSETVRGAVDKIFQSSQALGGVVEDFLNISRIEQGRMKYDFTTVDLKRVTKEVIDEQLPTIQQHRLEITFHANEHEDYSVRADFGKIKQVVGNIIDNAVKYTPQGSIAVTLSRDEETHTITLAVADTGLGIARDALPMLFEKFQRARNARQTDVSGTGLGLYLAKEIMKAHRGHVWAQSEGEGKGSTFYLEFKTNVIIGS